MNRLIVCLPVLVLAVSLAVGIADLASAQCTTCYSPAPAPTVAYQPVTTVQPAVAYEPSNRWYLGRMFDRMRLRRAGFAEAPTTLRPVVTSTTTATLTPAPTLAAYAPLGSYSVARPVYSSYSVPVASTVLRPVVAARPVALTPACVTCGMATASCGTCGCDPCGCSSCDLCSTSVGCSSCDAGFSTAGFVTSTPGCASCAAGSSTPSYSAPSYSAPPAASSPSIGPQTPQPSLKPIEPAPARSNYAPEATPETSPSPSQPVYPGPGEEDDEDASTYLDPPQLFNPRDVNARLNGPSTDVWTAVYRKPVTGTVSHSQPVQKTQAETDAQGWYSVPR